MEQATAVSTEELPQSTSFPAVRFSREATLELERLTIEGFKAVPRRGMEIGGVLLGSASASGYEVTDCAAIEIEHRTGPSYTLSEADWSVWEAAIDGLDDRDRIVGIFRSQTRPGMQPAHDDSRLSASVLPGRQGIFLLLKPLGIDSVVASMFLSEGGTIVDEVGAPREIAFGAKTLPPVPPQQRQERVLQMPAQEPVPVQQIASEPMAEEPEPVRSNKSRFAFPKLPWWIPVTAVAAGVMAAMYATQADRVPSSPVAPAVISDANALQTIAPIKSPSDSIAPPLDEKPTELDDSSAITATKQRRDVARGSRSAFRTATPQANSAEVGRQQPGRVKRFFHGVGSKATRIWPFHSKSQEPNR